MQNETFTEDQKDQDEETTIRMEYIIQIAGKHMFLSKIENLLYQENVPAIVVCTLLRFIK